MDGIIEYVKSCASLFPRMSWGNVVEIVIIAILIYLILAWIKDSKAWVLLRGIGIIVAFIFLCVILRLDTLLWIFGKIATVAAVAFIVIFQPELRKALEQLGSNSLLQKLVPVQQQTGFTEKTANEIVKAAFELGKTRTGALIVIGNKDSLEEIERTGIKIDGVVSSQLLINIFEHNTPLHDGAVVVRGNIITAATCYLPLSENMSISKSYGTRHRAALGISEETDSITVVVSEETGKVSVSEKGKLTVMQDAESLRAALSEIVDVDGNNKKDTNFIDKLRNKKSK
ncbi:MAG: diadenylate cyclase CdaA [Lachnospiraceae bacterium]|nr:diadenylate cyclase CdaA [Lachnospiraceae bacterium]